MYGVDGSLSQKWYFVPENAWPDGRLVVPSLKYFYIVNQTNKSVLEISAGTKGGDLVLHEVEPGKSSQLWRLDEDRRLVSKLGLVADIKGENKKPGTVCHAWNAHDGLNQKWHFEDDAIKSDLNNLVIDARTQTVSMYEVDGSLPQKWYFVPENAWPDGRLVVPSLKYFYIVNKTKKSVLEISTGKKGGDLVLSEALGKSNQLWRLDEDRRLVSKLGLVADIKGKKKKPGAVCHAWNARDDLSQKWHFEDDAIKSDFNNLVLDAQNKSVSMREEDVSSPQKWYFVPENAWPDGRLDVPSLKYFYIVNKTKKSVLEICTGTKGGDLVLSEVEPGKSSQLWRLDEDCRLVSKRGLVADIKGKNKKPGAVCHAWHAHDGLNQKWHFEDDAIKSDLNNLVIDARNQSVSMYEVDGNLPQKWYFVPENAWPDGRLVVPSVKYFFIVNQAKGSVLDISTRKKGGDLVLSEADGKPSQLWRWDKNCRLVSKLGFVADIKGKSKKAGAVCHAWDAHDGLNQKWRVEEGAIKSSLNGLVIDAWEPPFTMPSTTNATDGQSTQPVTLCNAKNDTDGQSTQPVTMPNAKNDTDGQSTQPVAVPNAKNDTDSQSTQPVTMPNAKNDTDGQSTQPVTMPNAKNDTDGQSTQPVTMPNAKNDTDGQSTQPVTMPNAKNNADGQSTQPVTMPSAKNDTDGQSTQLVTMPNDTDGQSTQPVTTRHAKSDTDGQSTQPVTMPNAKNDTDGQSTQPVPTRNAKSDTDGQSTQPVTMPNAKNNTDGQSTQPVTMRNAKDDTNGQSTQKWYFVPEEALNDFKLVQANPNPLNKAQFWKNLADNYLDVIIGYSIDDYEDKLHKAFKILDECSRKLNAVTKDTGIARTAGGSASIVGWGMVASGLALAPITAGASIGLTIAGFTTGLAGGLTSTATMGDKSS